MGSSSASGLSSLHGPRRCGRPPPTLGGTTPIDCSIHVSATSRDFASRVLPLRGHSPHASECARAGDELQLFPVSPLGRDLRLLRVRNGLRPGPSGEHRGVHLGRSNAQERALQDLRHRHALGANRFEARGAAWREPAQLRSQAAGVRGGQALRWRGHLGVHRLSS